MHALTHGDGDARGVARQAIVFYSSDAFGNLDDLSEHGACPVIDGEKWGANVRACQCAVPCRACVPCALAAD